jgi:hypothetical protein
MKFESGWGLHFYNRLCILQFDDPEGNIWTIE